jgi:hypothetical protein
MGYDMRPLQTLTEKEKFLNMAADNGFYMFLEHDAHNEVVTVKHSDKGVRLENILSATEVFN